MELAYRGLLRGNIVDQIEAISQALRNAVALSVLRELSSRAGRADE